MPTFFHGTTRQFATAMAAIPGTIDVNQGGGEFGRGFYTQTSVGNAMRWASGRSPNHAAVLQVDIDDPSYAALNLVRLNPARAIALTNRLRKTGSQGTYRRRKGCDVIEGPLNGKAYILQQKFESTNSQNLLNGPLTARTVSP